VIFGPRVILYVSNFCNTSNDHDAGSLVALGLSSM
jgi:hypothetical protein